MILIGILLSGCVSGQKSDFPSTMPTETAVVTTAIPSPTYKPSPSPTPSPTDTPSGNVLSKCVEITKVSLPPLQGTLVLEHNIPYTLKDILFLDMETNQEHFISKQGGEYYNDEAVSPAGTYFAADTFTFSANHEYQQGPIKVFDSHGNQVAKVEFKKESYGFTWLNESQIFIKDGDSLILTSPFNHTQKKIQPLIKHIFYPSEYFMDWGFYGDNRNVYGPQMTRMLYPLGDENGPTVALRDVEKGIDLASFPTSYGWGKWPTWSVDGKKFAIALNVAPFVSGEYSTKYEIFVINHDGELLLNTNLTPFSKTVYMSNLSWSPDGRYIAFWYTNDENHLYDYLQLAVFDTETRMIARYCINNGDDYIRFSPIWAPSNDYLLIAYRTSKDDKALSSLLLNILDGKAWIIKSDFEPLGWLK